MKKALVLWFTGLSGSGKTTIANELAKVLKKENLKIEIFDGDVIRAKFHTHLSFTPVDIKKNNKLIAEFCLKQQGQCDCILVPIISPFKESRAYARKVIGDNFVEVYIKVSLSQAIQRDVKGLYKKALAGEIDNFIGVCENVPYESPLNPEITLDTEQNNLKTCIDQLQTYINIRLANSK